MGWRGKRVPPKSSQDIILHVSISTVRGAFTKSRCDPTGTGVAPTRVFRYRLSQYDPERGTSLPETAFANITDRQMPALAVPTGQQRMSSTQTASNLVLTSRLQWTVEPILRLLRLLSEADRLRYTELQAPCPG
jgi:hypothetical protein